MSSKKVLPVSFVFGSSTPRELSHHSDDCAKKGLKAKLEAGGDNAKRRGDILYYMRQAKSTDIKDSRNGGGVRARAAVAYAFGSSTPRSLSHMSKVPREQRVYDAKLAKQRTAAAADGLRVSTTNLQLSGNRPKRWISAGGRSVSVESQNDGDEAASEPDFVQDRMVDFSRNISSSSTKRAASGTPKKDSTTKTEDGRGTAKAKNSGAGTSMPPNNRKKISSSSSTTTTVQIQQQQKGRENGEEKWEDGDGAVSATSVDKHQQAAEVQAVQQGHQNSMGMMEMNRNNNNNNYGNGVEEEENINNGEKEMGEEGRGGGGQNEEKSRGGEEERQFDI